MIYKLIICVFCICPESSFPDSFYIVFLRTLAHNFYNHPPALTPMYAMPLRETFTMYRMKDSDKEPSKYKLVLKNLQFVAVNFFFFTKTFAERRNFKVMSRETVRARGDSKSAGNYIYYIPTVCKQHVHHP